MTLARSFATRRLAWPAHSLDVHSHQDAAGIGISNLVELATTGDEQAEVAARPWARRWLRHEDIAVDAHHDLDVLA
jgi:hypothetical protein